MKGKLSIIGEEHEHRHDACVAVNIHPPSGLIEKGKFKGRAAVITLGCAKNQVDSEVMLGVLRNTGYEIVGDVKEADIAIVNTCGFLESAVKESIDCVLDVSDLKENGRLRKLIVAGCAVSRYRGDLKAAMPEVDSFIGTDDLLKVGQIADEGGNILLEDGARPYFIYDETMPRHLASLRHTAYVKVAEGCDRPCTFCIIPRIRGAMRSRSIDSVVNEVIQLGSQGVKEVNLVAQDLTSYGKDRSGEDLVALLKKLNHSAAVDWIRLLYAYPIGINEELIDTIVESPRICTYLDLPLQHASERVLKEMKRPLGRYAPRAITEFMKKRQPGLKLRTTFIVGFPGETDADVDELESFIREGHFSSVGIFTYSKEQGTPAGEMSGQVSEDAKAERLERLMLAQQEVSTKHLESYIGQTLDVLVEGLHEETELLLSGRTEFQAPEVDGTVIINDVDSGLTDVQVGMMGRVEITEVAGYDLVGSLRAAK